MEKLWVYTNNDKSYSRTLAGILSKNQCLMNTVPYELIITLYQSQADFVLTDSSTKHFTSTHFEIVQTRQSFSSTSIIIIINF